MYSNNEEDLAEIEFSPECGPEVKQTIKAAHAEHSQEFNKDLTDGYNGYFGKRECQLNWSSKEMPIANKVRVANYDHNLKGLMQEMCDKLTEQGVLTIPQEQGVRVQAVCPSFLERKQRGKGKKHLLTAKDVRLIIKFNPVNEYIKNLPTPMVTTNNVFIKLKCWKHIVIFDLDKRIFQNHMAKDARPWLGLMTPFGGLRILKRSGQGLVGQSKGMDELLSKVLKDKMKEGSVQRSPTISM